MNGDFIFLVLFLIQFVLWIVLRGYYQMKSPDRKKSLRELTKSAFEHEGRQSIIFASLLGVVMIVALVLYIFYPTLFPWLVIPFPDWLRWLGVIIGFISIFFFWWAHSTLGQAFSKALTIQEKHSVVSDGPYRRIRHPMYTASIIYFFSWFLIAANLIFIILWLFFLGWIFTRMPKEEEMLVAQFGDEYREYMKRTGRLLPPFRKKSNSDDTNQV
ncbi:MAG: isoprenylcysteine carboxylmethyltransferase family protein [Candidatus Hermodarchaeota archaeon]